MGVSLSIPLNDVVAIEQASEFLARAINMGDISALSDFFAPNAVVLAPARPAIKGAQLASFFRNMALRNEGLRLLSDDMEPFGPDAVRDVGTLSLRVKQQGDERMIYKYLMLWQKAGIEWKLSTMTWNRAPTNRPGRAAQGADDGEM